MRRATVRECGGDPVRVLSFSYCFPSGVHPTWGIFVLQRLAALSKFVDLEVIAPVPVFPLWSRLCDALPPTRERHSGITVHHPRFFYIPGAFKFLDGRLYARGLRDWLDNGVLSAVRPDLLDAHFVWPDGVAVHLLAERLGVPYVITLRGKIYSCLADRRMRRQVAEALRNAAAVISVSAAMAEAAVALGAAPERLHVIPNGVDRDLFHPRDKHQSRRALGLPLDQRLIVCVAHLQPSKGHEELVGAMARLSGDVRLVIVGGQAQRGYRRKLASMIDRMGLSSRVLLAGGQPYQRIPIYLGAADVSVLASHQEGCPNVVLESLACGRPVVATRVGAVPEIIRPGRNGKIVPVRDERALADAIEDVLSRHWPAEKLSRCRAVRSWDTVARKVHRTFRRVLADRNKIGGAQRAGAKGSDNAADHGQSILSRAGAAARPADLLDPSRA